MILKKIKYNIIKELIIPKILVTNYPGVVINKQISRFSKKFKMMRVVYIFENFAIDLYNETVPIIGKEKTDLLWYEISKNATLRYMIFFIKPKVHPLLINTVLEYLFQSFAYLGVSSAEKFRYNNKSIITYGKNCLICRKNNAECIPAGHLSAIWSYINGENIEAEPHCKNCPNQCKMVANKNIKEKCKINYKELEPIKNYNSINTNYDKSALKKNPSFYDFIKFKKIHYNERKNIAYFKETGITYLEVGVLELIYKEYEKYKYEKLFSKILIESSKKIMNKFCIGDVKKDLQEMEGFISAFGWGIPNHSIKNDKIIYHFTNPPICKYPPIFRATVLNGFLNSIFNKEYEIEKVNNSEMIFKKI